MARVRLLSLLDDGVRRRLTIVVAPPGYGKTALLAQWVASLAARRAEAASVARVRWLTLTAEHDDPKRLPKDLWRLLQWPSPSCRGPATRQTARRTTVLVLDDFHVLSDPLVIEQVGLFIQRAPRWLRVVLSTRVDPPPGCYCLSLVDALTELRQEDLAFTRDEAAELLRLHGQDLSGSQIDVLLDRTEGWALGLQLATTVLRDHSDPAGVLAAFGGDDPTVAAYLAAQVLDLQPDRIRRFLLGTSVLDRLDGPVCDFVLGGSSGQAMLEHLEQTSSFITRIKPGSYSFRYHPMFRSFLRRRLHTEDPDLERRLLARAAEWHLARGDLESGVSYLHESRAYDQVAEQAFAHGALLLGAGRAGMVAGWIDRIPASHREGRVDLALLQAGSMIFGGDTAGARRILAAVDTPSSGSAVECAVADVLRSWSWLREGSATEALVAADRALGASASIAGQDVPDVLGLITSSSEVATAASVIRGAALMLQGDFAEATHALEPCLDTGHVIWQLYALGSLALAKAWSGRLSETEELGARALTMARELGWPHDGATTCARLALADVARERMQLERARVLLDEAEGQLARNPGHVLVKCVAVERALLALTAGDPAAGLAILDDTGTGQKPLLPPALLARWRTVEAQLHLATGDLERADMALRLPEALDTPELVALRVRLAVERRDLETARALVRSWPARQTPRAELEGSLCLAVLDHLEGAAELARTRMESVVRAAEIEGTISLVRGAGIHTRGVMRALYKTAPTPFLGVLLDERPVDARPRPVRELAEQITDREYVVLNLLPTWLSNIEIAERLDVSINTVKTHLKHIYRKLGVAGRAEAVAAAEALNLV